VGAAGQLLTKMIEAMGLKREEIYIANVLKCRPDLPEGSVGNRKPTAQEMKSCIPYLEAQIKIVQPKILVALGATAIEGLLHEKTPIGKLRGNWRSFQGIPLIPTYHPTYLLRNQSVIEKRKVWEDLLQVMEALNLPISAKQRGYFLSKAS
jgi:DNA polymerase